MTFLDTADMYGPFTNERLVGKAIASRRDEVRARHQVRQRPRRGRRAAGHPRRRRLRPQRLRGLAARLGIDHIDLYYQHRVDTEGPDRGDRRRDGRARAAGKVRHLGLSEAGADTIRRAHAVHPITALQSEYSLFSRDIETEIRPVLGELGIGLVAYSPLGRGFLTGAITTVEDLDAKDVRRMSPRFAQEALEANLRLVEKIKAIAADKGVTPGQIALAWVLAQGEDVVPIPGTKRRRYLEENAAAVEVTLTEADLARLAAAIPAEAVRGDRYADMSPIGR